MAIGIGEIKEIINELKKAEYAETLYIEINICRNVVSKVYDSIDCIKKLI